MKKAQAVRDSVAILEKLQAATDYEESHGIADDLLCELLKAEGYGEVVDAYKKLPKWYA